MAAIIQAIIGAPTTLSQPNSTKFVFSSRRSLPAGMMKCVVLLVVCSFISISYAKNISNNVRAVNLGGWLVTEGWITPSLFDGIPNKDFLDGTQLQFKSSVGKYLSAESGGGKFVVANRTSNSTWETFTLWRLRENVFYLRVFKKQFMGMDSDGVIVASENKPSLPQEFQIERNPDDPTRVRIMASNGRYIQVKSEELITADFMGNVGWADDDPSVFRMSIVRTLRGEFQVTNGYGPAKAPHVMREHWNTFIVENDFKFLSRNGLNAVRIAVGWWIASDPSPPEPYVSGSLHILDKAFLWARIYGLKVIVTLHAAPGSQNHWEHSSTRDGSLEWGKSDESIQQSISVIEFLTARYARNPNLYGIELLNEPIAPGVDLETLKKYYEAGYNVVRKHSQTAKVVMCNRLPQGIVLDESELISFASGLKGSVIDVHYYTGGSPHNTVAEIIDIVKTTMATRLSKLITPDGPLIFVGEWTGDWDVKNASKVDFIKFTKVQQEVYGKATLGWGYWTYKTPTVHWSLKWMITHGYMKIA